MARGRHAKRSGLLARLFPGRAARRRGLEAQQRAVVQAHFDEVHRLRTVGTRLAGEAAAAGARARRAEETAVVARAEVADLRAETAVLRDELARLREELLWAWAADRLPERASDSTSGRVVDLRTG